MSETEHPQFAPPPEDEIIPAHEKDLDSDGDSVLSDVDEDVFNEFDEKVIGTEHVIPIDEETVHAIGKHKIKRTGGETASTGKKKEKRRRDIAKRRRDDDEDDAGPSIRRAAPEVELTPAEKARKELDDKINAALKGPKKKKKKDDVDLEVFNDDLILTLKERMREAAEADQNAIRNGSPAVHKLAMLEEVRDVLQRPNLMATAMDNNFLEAIKWWLEPLPNKALPAYSIQKLMFEIMGKIKMTTDYLRESGVGKVVMFYTKDKRPQLHIKREADRLIGEWSRPILGRSDDYHSREIPVAGRDHGFAPRPRQRPDEEEHNPLAPPQRNQNRTRVPQAMPRSYEIAPQNRVVSGPNPYAKQMGSAGDDMIRRMKAKRQAQNKGKKSGMIIG
ncbi:uncharacterized protein H6S33_011257 [Morchella sextelata]|uniref:uncharacterized protein n=1 Tax=Morchella sextelata TaxID=1174677 RepID=UPI001D05BC94|nr:uncharacterized protein H6S33_011257 [Morchella sextelata]KAH0610830.1 hypothetical protein H6S33_011257 [Morchella sextelata]